MASTLTAPLRHTPTGGAVDLETAGHRQGQALLEKEVALYLAEKASLRRMCLYVGDISGSASDTFRELYAQIGFGLSAAALAEGGTITPSTVNVDYTDIQVGQRGLLVNETFLAQITGRQGKDLDLEMLARMAGDTYEATFSDDVADLVATASSTVGSTGVDMSMDDFYDGIYFHTLQDGQDNTLAAVLHGRQVADLIESKRGEPAEWVKDTNIQAWTGMESQGVLAGVPVFKNNRIYSDGADRYGGMFTPRAMRYANAQAALSSIKGLSSRAMIIPNPGIVVDFGGVFGVATTGISLYFVYGLAIGDQGQKEIVGIVTDA